MKWAMLKVFRSKYARIISKYSSIRKMRNIVLVIYELRKRRTTLKSMPISAVIDTTNICNLRCPLCPTGAKEYGRPKGRMGLQQFKTIIDQIADYCLELNLFSWGEPLVNNEIFAMIEYAHIHRIYTCICTNLTLITDETAEALVRSGLDRLTVSLDGTTPETYGKYRVGGDFNRVVANIRLISDCKKKLKSSTPFIEWQFLVFKHNRHQIEEMKQLYRKMGVNGLLIRNAVDGASVSTDTQVATSGLDYVLSGEERKEHIEPGPRRERPCDLLWYQITINHDGGVAPCCLAYKKESDFANVFTDGTSLREVWNSSQFRAARSVFRDGRTPADLDNLCARCYFTKEFLSGRKENTLGGHDDNPAKAAGSSDGQATG